jgi:hypothetical protein
MKDPIIYKKLEDKLKVYSIIEDLPLSRRSDHTETESINLPALDQGIKYHIPLVYQYIPKFHNGEWIILRILEIFS